MENYLQSVLLLTNGNIQYSKAAYHDGSSPSCLQLGLEGTQCKFEEVPGRMVNWEEHGT